MMVAKTKRGHDPFTIISALQKYVRRGMEREAMKCAIEMMDSSKAYTSWLLNRLIVILFEDVGPGEPVIGNYVMLAVQAAKQFQKDDKMNEVPNVVAGAIVAMCRAKKTHVANNLEVAARAELNASPLTFHDFVYDCHTQEGKKRGRGVDHWLAEGAKIVPEHPLYSGTNDPHEADAVAWYRGNYKGGSEAKKASTQVEEPVASGV